MKTSNSGNTLHSINLKKHAKPAVLSLIAIFIISMLSVFASTASPSSNNTRTAHPRKPNPQRRQQRSLPTRHRTLHRRPRSTRLDLLEHKQQPKQRQLERPMELLRKPHNGTKRHNHNHANLATNLAYKHDTRIYLPRLIPNNNTSPNRLKHLRQRQHTIQHLNFTPRPMHSRSPIRNLRRHLPSRHNQLRNRKLDNLDKQSMDKLLDNNG